MWHLPPSGLNPRLLHWQADSLPLSHQGRPHLSLLKESPCPAASLSREIPPQIPRFSEGYLSRNPPLATEMAPTQDQPIRVFQSGKREGLHWWSSDKNPPSDAGHEVQSLVREPKSHKPMSWLSHINKQQTFLKIEEGDSVKTRHTHFPCRYKDTARIIKSEFTEGPFARNNFFFSKCIHLPKFCFL